MAGKTLQKEFIGSKKYSDDRSIELYFDGRGALISAVWAC